MQDYKKTSHTVYDCTYHIVWVTKYRYRILVGDIGRRARELIDKHESKDEKYGDFQVEN
ncbi:MAG: transposase [Rickettsiaceae bacterium]|uniref:Transposase n=1 Tax=Candidatus Dojkabacteria bacterium TaxID=2099670 RepID=A0A955RKS5_9BACT|nr:transposase [Candidatus Dojkabacteria bacterium]MCP5375177.1 transposase [Rickettsiaceae bacterium]